MSFATDHNTFERIRLRWDEAVKSNFEGFDPEMVELCKEFNEIPGVASFMSCAGHEVGRRDSVVSRKPTYISFAFTDEGMKNIMRVFAILQSQFLQKWPTHSYLRRPSPRHLFLSFGLRAGNEDWWTSGCVTLTHRSSPMYEFEKVRTAFIEMFRQSIAYAEIEKGAFNAR